MELGLKIILVDPDEDYLGLEVIAASKRFSGSTRIYAGFDELSKFAACIEGFPKTPDDERIYEFGSTDSGVAGGFARLRFYCIDGAGHSAMEITIEDDELRHTPASAKFSFRIEAGGLDRFLRSLLAIERKRYGKAKLALTVF